MRNLMVSLTAFAIPLTLFGQASINFDNATPGLDCRFRLADGTPIGAGYTAQLFAGPLGTSLDRLTGLTPATTFRTGAAAGYVVPVDVLVPGAVGSKITVAVRIFDGTSTVRAEFGPCTITVGSGLQVPPPDRAAFCDCASRPIQASLPPPSIPNTAWSEDFETAMAMDDWFADGGVWEIGVPTSGPKGAHSGKHLVATILAGDYPDNVSSRLIGPRFVVASATSNPRFRFWHWFSFNEGDTAQVQIRTNGGSWMALSSVFRSSGGGVWSQASLDLTAYASQTVQIGFLFTSQNIGGSVGNYNEPETSAGWYVDEVALVSGPMVLNNPEGFEFGWGDWSADGGTWEVGVPTSGPVKAQGGTNCAATVLRGNYLDGVGDGSGFSGNANGTASRLISPAFVVPSAGSNPRLRFWHWFSFNEGDIGQVQIRTNGGPWVALSSDYRSSGGSAWSQPSFDLSTYAGQSVQVGFLFTSRNIGGSVGNYDEPETSAGWYVDEVALVSGPVVFNNPEGFEFGWGDWSADGGTWEVGVPTSGPVKAQGGTNCAATVLRGNYLDGVGNGSGSYGNANGTASRLISPAFVVPSAGSNPRLRFWHWFSFNEGDIGQVQIRTNGGPWVALSSDYRSSGGSVWSQPSFDLSTYAGQSVQVGFLFTSRNIGSSVGNYDEPEISAGWYVDEIKILSDQLARLLNQTVIEEKLLTAVVSAAGGNIVYSLGTGAPNGASIDPILGIFTWIPSECQGPSTNSITINATDPNSSLKPLTSTIFIVTVLETNSPPLIDPIATKAIKENELLRFTVTALDQDCPEKQILTYSLEQGAPTGATIDSVTGTFVWIPTAAQAATSHSITVRATDNGSPAMSSTATFVATTDVPETRLVAARGAGGAILLRLDGGSVGVDYAIQATSQLNSPPATTVWTILKTVRPNQLPFTFDDPEAATLPMRFYRILRSQ